MKTAHDMVQELVDNGFDQAQEARFNFASGAAKIAAVTIMAARHGVGAVEMIQALTKSKNLNTELEALFFIGTECPEFVGFVHSDIAF